MILRTGGCARKLPSFRPLLVPSARVFPCISHVARAKTRPSFWKYYAPFRAHSHDSHLFAPFQAHSHSSHLFAPSNAASLSHLGEPLPCRTYRTPVYVPVRIIAKRWPNFKPQIRPPARANVQPIGNRTLLCRRKSAKRAPAAGWPVNVRNHSVQIRLGNGKRMMTLGPLLPHARVG